MAGQQLAVVLIDHLFIKGLNTTDIKLVLHIDKLSDYRFIEGFESVLNGRKHNELNEMIGWDLGFDDALPQIGIQSNI